MNGFRSLTGESKGRVQGLKDPDPHFFVEFPNSTDFFVEFTSQRFVSPNVRTEGVQIDAPIHKKIRS